MCGMARRERTEYWDVQFFLQLNTLLMKLGASSQRSLSVIWRAYITSSPVELVSINTHILAINVPVVFMVRYVMVLRGATSLRGSLEGVGTENRDFFGP